MRSKNIEDKVLDTIKKNKLIEQGDKIVLAVSGGPDSICMLDLLFKISRTKMSHSNPEPMTHFESFKPGTSDSFEIVVAHVNHMIREEAIDDELFVKNFCEERNIDFYSKSIDVQKIANNKRIGLEEAGRMARYDFFDEVAKKTESNKIAIAHNKNDSVETVIMHALRGSGTLGLQGIQAKNDKYIRPLIECERIEIEQYCKVNNIEARIDKTNFENDYTRNKIRNVVIPYIKEEFNPNIIETIYRLSNLIKDENIYIENQVEKIYEEILINQYDNNVQDDKKQNNNNEIVLDLKKFNEQEKVIKSRIVLYTINRLFGTSKGIEKIHIEDILKLCKNNVGNKYLTPNKNIKVFVKLRKSTFYQNRRINYLLCRKFVIDVE